MKYRSCFQEAKANSWERDVCQRAEYTPWDARHLGSSKGESTFGQGGTPGPTSWRRVFVLSPEGGHGWRDGMKTLHRKGLGLPTSVGVERKLGRAMNDF